MGRWYASKKTEADWLKKVEMSFLKKHGYLSWWSRSDITWTNKWADTKSSVTIESTIRPPDPHVRFIYTQTDRDTGEQQHFDYKVRLATTPCHYGGKRYWFICSLSVNGKYCGRRVGVLYKGGDYFGCRHCYNLTYDSKNENRRYRSYPLFQSLTYYKQMDELKEKIKRRDYAGKPTRKQKKLYDLQLKTLHLMPLVSKL